MGAQNNFDFNPLKLLLRFRVLPARGTAWKPPWIKTVRFRIHRQRFPQTLVDAPEHLIKLLKTLVDAPEHLIKLLKNNEIWRR
ncbi:hypothetical protein EUGRSUZ_L02316 [Eucalyptus grandis]|uniref:Uncharacterized protein n=2 Tax=Eucalyptus grandis TaxID=71139 RepID=A0AAD9T9G1_EUCGR|nr:hypothetical protein EUGRSUZ_L02316 [Eucalyptus grandis]